MWQTKVYKKEKGLQIENFYTLFTMSKLVHNVQKKQHRERSQTQNRAKFGFLEKKKDYKLRADDYHKKQAALKRLRSKVNQHNPDEYYHGMTRRSTDKSGALISDRGNESLSVDEVKLLKTQDVNYVRTMRLNDMHKIEKQKQNLGFKAQGKHTVFVDNQQEQEQFDPKEYFNTDEDLLYRRENRIPMDRLRERTPTPAVNGNKKGKGYRELKARLERQSRLGEVEQRMERQRELMKKGGKKKVGDEFKWKRERKR